MKRLFLIAAIVLLPLPAHAVCENKAPWAKGYSYFATIPVYPYRSTSVIEDRVYLLQSPGTDGKVLAVLRPRYKALKIGETFDRQCRQWVKVGYFEPGYDIPTIGWIRGEVLK